MSATPMAPKTASRADAMRVRLSLGWTGSEAKIYDISSAPSMKRRRERLCMEAPRDARRPVVPRRSDVRSVVSEKSMLDTVLKVGMLLVLTCVLSIVAAGVGLSLQGGHQDIETTTRSVRAGESVWSLAASIESDRPLDEIVSDIEALNEGIDGTLRIGQRVVLPRR